MSRTLKNTRCYYINSKKSMFNFWVQKITNSLLILLNHFRLKAKGCVWNTLLKQSCLCIKDGETIPSLFYVFILAGDIFSNHLIGNVPGADREKTSSPQMLAPKCFLKRREFRKQLTRGFTLEILGNLADRELGRSRDENMDMVSRNMASQYLNVISEAYFSD